MSVKLHEFEHHYIDKQGNVYNEKTKHYLKSYLGKNGYFVVDIWENNKRYKRYIHRLLGVTFLPNLYNKRTINHIDGNKQNNSLDNIEWATDSENVKHAYIHNLNHQTKADLSKNDLQDIWNKFLNHETLTSISKQYKLGLTTISNYLNRFVQQHNLEKEFTEEKNYQLKLRISNRDMSKRNCSVWMCNLNTHTKIQQFPTMKAAIEFLGVKSSGPISNVIAKRQKSAYGYYWIKA